MLFLGFLFLVAGCQLPVYG
ncbi:hypothetical protein IBL28_04240 [Sinomicrobium sp. FJxs]|uniref:Uncharacterized protein n=1 Tax=Sinomicrobium weinanense TaxID=2842200 RepID=A0A926JPP1_9FLAO|nr:hypothetical protein [Sinomicrobium weinanense]MBU3121940.1 hypothetical protein [Sinomicrobium weinanense]